MSPSICIGKYQFIFEASVYICIGKIEGIGVGKVEGIGVDIENFVPIP